jgi:hypothetical protein
MFVAFMPLHILLCDEVLPYFIYVSRSHSNLKPVFWFKRISYYKRIEIEKISISPTTAWAETHNRTSNF